MFLYFVCCGNHYFCNMATLIQSHIPPEPQPPDANRKHILFCFVIRNFGYLFIFFNHSIRPVCGSATAVTHIKQHVIWTT